MSNVIKIDEARIRDHPGELVRETVEDSLNELLDAEAEQLRGVSAMSAPRPGVTQGLVSTEESFAQRQEK